MFVEANTNLKWEALMQAFRLWILIAQEVVPFHPDGKDRCDIFSKLRTWPGFSSCSFSSLSFRSSYGFQEQKEIMTSIISAFYFVIPKSRLKLFPDLSPSFFSCSSFRHQLSPSESHSDQHLSSRKTSQVLPRMSNDWYLCMTC